MPERMILTNRYYRHFKGRLYFVLCIATHSETGERLVVYKQCYGDHEFYVRPYDMFASRVDRVKYPNADQEYRFELVKEGAAE